jgi:hypothetical protein
MNIVEYNAEYVIIVAPDGRMFTAKLVPKASLTVITRGTLRIPEFNETDVAQRASRVSPQGAENALRAMLDAPAPERIH